MKSLKSRLIAVMASTAVFGVLAVPYSFSQSTALKANVPFDFYVNGKLMPAGTYRLKPMTPDNWAIHITDDVGDVVMVGTIPNDHRKPSVSRLVFHRYGSLNFLSELEWEGSSIGRVIPKSSAEREILASTAPVKVKVAAK